MKLLKSITILSVLFALLISMSTPVYATEPAFGIPEKQLKQTVDNYVKAHKDTTAAMSIAVFTKDNTLFEKPYGYLNVDEKMENDPDAVFEWASITKLLTWVSVMRLVEEGKIDLNEDIRNYLPKGFLKKLTYDEPITMTHLMNHTPGWQNVIMGLDVPEGEDIKDLEDALQSLEPVQVFRPGEYTAYSNYGSALAGYIVERLSGKPFYAYVHENIFAPLEMKHTAIKPDLSDNPWVKERRGDLICYTPDLQSLGAKQFVVPLYPCGQAMGTLADLRKFAQALLPDENGNSILFKKAETLTLLYTPTSYYPDGTTARYCHGFWALAGYQGKVVGHAGNSSCSSMLAIDPDAGVGAVVMTNQQMEGIYNYSMLYEILGGKDLSPTENLTDEDISGVYTWTQNVFKGFLKTVGFFQITPIQKNDDGTLSNPMGGTTFEYVAPGVYKGSLGDIIMPAFAEFDKDGQVKKLSMTPTDFIPLSWGAVYFDIALLVLFVISAIYGLLAFFVMLIRKLRKKKQPLGALRVAVCLSALGALINFVSMIAGPLSPGVITVHGILFILFALLPVAYTILMIDMLKKQTAGLSGKQKRQLITTSVFGLLMTINVFYWQLWMFWV